MGMIADKIDEQWQLRESRNKGHRVHLGGSKIGSSCKRQLWYDFRWCTDEVLEGRKYRLFQRGQNEEKSFVQQLQWIGAEVVTVNLKTRKQWQYSFFGGHVGGSLDGVARGLPILPLLWTLLEFKTHNNKSFKQLVKKGVRESKPFHWAQMQLYMGWAGLKRALYLAINKDDDTLYDEFVDFDENEFKLLMDKAEDVVFSPKPIERVSETHEWFECRYCDHRFICHEANIDPNTNAVSKTAAVNCRTCLHSTPAKDGSWICEYNNRNIKLDEIKQRRACTHHRFIPELIPFATVIDADIESNSIQYQIKPSLQSCPPNSSVTPDPVFFRNGAHYAESYESRELEFVTINQIGDPFIEDIRDKFSAEFRQDDEPLIELEFEEVKQEKEA